MVSSQEVLPLSGKTMGTRYSIKVSVAESAWLDNSKLDFAKALQKRIDERLQAINQCMSTYQSDSEISRFNSHQSTEAVTASNEFIAVLQRAQEISRISNGRFDITVGPLVRFWGFGNSTNREKLPDESELDTVFKRVGFDKLSIESSSNQISKKLSGLEVDVSAIAKGYAVDQVAEILQEVSTDFLVEIGGEIRAQGENPASNRPWRIAIEKPTSNPLEPPVPFATVDLNNQSLATSGDYRNITIIEGKKFQHTIDPSSGFPVSSGIRSVSVIAKNCMDADAFATALMVFPLEELKEFVKSNDLSVLVVYEQKGELKTWKSARFPGEVLADSKQPSQALVNVAPNNAWKTILATASDFCSCNFRNGSWCYFQQPPIERLLRRHVSIG